MCAPPPFEAAPAWLGQLSFGALHVAMAVCHDWRIAAREDVRFHALRVRAPLRVLHAAQGTSVLPDIDLSSAQVCAHPLCTQHPLCTCAL